VQQNPWQAMTTMARVIYALMLRETKTRYGRLQIGYLWAFVEPILFITVLGLVFTYLRLREQFLLTGFVPFFLFRDIVVQTMMAVKQNLQLLYFPQVQVFDLGISRTLLELSTFVIVFTTLTFAISFTEVEVVVIDDILQMLLATCLIAAFAYGTGTVFGALIPLFPSLQFMVQVAYLRPMLFMSGVFYTIEMIPEPARVYAAWNPMLQLIELMRSAYFPGYDSEYVDFSYLIPVIVATVLIGLLTQRALRRYAFQA
jgi:capsular polysaccharide transport system permease protein